MHPAAMLLWLLKEPLPFFHCEKLLIIHSKTLCTLGIQPCLPLSADIAIVYSIITRLPIPRSGALQQTFHGSPPAACPVSGFPPPCQCTWMCRGDTCSFCAGRLMCGACWGSAWR